MFKGLKFNFSKKIGISTELDVINQNLKSIKFSNSELDNFIKICNRLIETIDGLLIGFENKFKTREINNEELYFIAFEIERAKSNPDVQSSLLLKLEDQYIKLLNQLIQLYLQKLKNGTYKDYELYNKFLDILSDLEILLNNNIFKAKFNEELFFKNIAHKVLDKKLEISIVDLKFLFDKIFSFKSEISREYFNNEARISSIELSDDKKYYDYLEEKYNNRKR